MKCIILAAGRNTRLDNGIPKSMLKVGDETLMERHIRLFRHIGVTQFCVITGYRHQMLEAFFASRTEYISSAVQLIHNPEFDRANGVSLNCASDWVGSSDEPFFFTMADHFFTEAFLKEVIKAVANVKTLTLVVDRPSEINKHIDLEDVTKVKTSKGLIVEIGKQLKEYDCYDTGLFMARKVMFEHLRTSIANGGDSISNMVQALAGKGLADVYEVNGHFWNDVDTPSDLATTRDS